MSLRPILMLLGIGALVASAAEVRAATTQVAIVVGYNGSSRPDVAPLRYADDDAVKNAALLGELGVATTLLVDLDADSRALFPALEARAPTRTELQDAIAAAQERLAEAKSRGESTVLFFFYSGHGDVEHGEGFLELSGDRLTRSHLRALVASSGADAIHLVIDACKSYFAVFDRGAESRRAVSGPFLRPEEPLADNIGVLLSTSSDGDSHEWEAYQGGIFSHEVRSALRGAADLDGDGTISYDEVGAFVYTANRAIPNARFRPDFFVRAPSLVPSPPPLVRLGAETTASRLLIGPGVDAHLYVEDGRGLRLADLHPAAGSTIALVLPDERPLFVHASAPEREYTIEATGDATLAALTPMPPEAQTRGALHVAFTHLFTTAFDASAPAAYRADALARRTEASLAMQVPPARHTWRRGLGIGGALLVAAGAGFGLHAVYERNGVDASTSNSERAERNALIARDNRIAVPLYGVGAASLVAYALWSYFDRDPAPASPPPGSSGTP